MKDFGVMTRKRVNSISGMLFSLKPKKWNISKDSKTYIEAKETAQNIISILKIIIVQNNEIIELLREIAKK